MAYGDYNGPDKHNKGHEGGACNRSRCQAEPALWHNHLMNLWYCEDCAKDIGLDWVNLSDWQLRYQPELGHNQFRTREMIDAHEANKLIVQDKMNGYEASMQRHCIHVDLQYDYADLKVSKRALHAERPKRNHPTSPRQRGGR